MEKNIWDELTPIEKIEILNDYHTENKNTNTKAASMALMLSNIIYKAVKIQSEKILYIVDDIVKESSSFVTKLIKPEPYEKQIGNVKVLAKFRPRIDKFKPTFYHYENAILLEKYIDHEYEKLKENTIKYEK